MKTALRPRTLVLFLGDVFFFAFSLWVTLAVRMLALPHEALLADYAAPFAFLFLVWVLVYFIAGLYESRSIIFERRALSSTLLTAQIVNVGIAALFFFLVPEFGIAPKTILLIYLVISFLFVLTWRVFFFPWLGLQKSEAALAVGAGVEIEELVHAIEHAHHAPARIVAVLGPEGVLTEAIRRSVTLHHVRFIIADFSDDRVASAFPELYTFLASGIRFVDALELHEEVFGRVSLSQINERWLVHNVSRYSHVLYDLLKRVIDIIIALPAALLSLFFYPFIIVAIKIQDGGPIFYKQMRTGQNNVPFAIVKFRSMTGMDQGTEVLKSKLTVTSFGKLLRASRLDELPQLWSVLRGDMSLIGPRPEIPAMVAEYERAIPYYGVRHLVKPGLSGWAQLYHDNHPHHGMETEATREKLSYDLYYLKHRSLVLDLTIALKTIKKLLTRSGV
ncbi:MAG TPA: exopolysaccharide biosynthesis polyprenyl glycosylphosphotransferase [Candidatus Paceibacterota bacterium]